ncbi:AzlD domain-containing protein [Maritimibacter sp. DP1N21-5]|uniref:AzlD domain-containing protein n=1 Tax=Maritimibacter sp. DP1N21-5 TaxID=2836867 RepID=UPI001C472F25|nr:AzlD domain-containing protein [Maritimibacter sp. DP1N21-5]MBV7407923.1 AzlD domain-containing protein [Maritimibacter sp. DP1N21-5]
MSIPDSTIWIVIVLLGIGTFLIRFSFLGLIGDRELPAWVLRMLRYTPVAVIPGLVAPLVLWPAATGGVPDPSRLAAAVVTLGVGVWTKNVLMAIMTGAGTLYLMLWLVG